MDFIITKEQQQMQKAAREFLNKECDSTFVRDLEQSEKGFSDGLWKKMAALDWMEGGSFTGRCRSFAR